MLKKALTIAALALLSLVPTTANAQSVKLHGNVINGYHNGYEESSRYYEEWSTWNVGIWTFENGEMTKDLALITTLKDVKTLNTEDFIKAIRRNFDNM